VTHDAGWRTGLSGGGNGTREASWPDGGLPDAASLARGLSSLRSQAFGCVTKVLGRDPNPFRSTFPSEIVTVAFDDGSVRRIFVKRYIPGLHDGHGYWGGSDYESRVYSQVLAPLGLGTPAYVGTWPDPVTHGTFVAIEFVEGHRLNKSPTSRMVDAARWTARLHRDATPIAVGRTGLRAYDETFFRSWSGRALRYVQLARPGCAWIGPLIRWYDELLLPRLVGAEQVVIHGELYAENMIVAEDRICTVDWQSAAMGPGEIDFASLTEGPWPVKVVRAWQDEYIRSRWPGVEPSTADAAIDAARIHWRLRWLGDDPAWTASTRRAHYIEDLHALAKRLGQL
jgi:hypothetical protein